MSRLPRMSDATDRVAADDQPHYTLVTNNNYNYNHNNTQTSPHQTDASALSISGKQTAKDIEFPNSSSLPVVPNGRKLSLGSGSSGFPVQPSSPTLKQSKINTIGDNSPLPLKTASIDKPFIPALEATRGRGPKRTYKRRRANNNDDAHALPVPRRSSGRVRARAKAELAIKEAPFKAEVPTETDVCRGGDGPVKIDNSHMEEEAFAIAEPAEITRTDNHDKLVESKGLTKKRKARLKTVPKGPSAAPGRRHANATGRKRKMKCKHNPSEQESREDVGAKERTDQPITMTEAEAITMYTQASDAETPKDEAQVALQLESANCLDGADGKLPKKSKAGRKPGRKKAAGLPERKKATVLPERTSTRNRRVPERFATLEKYRPAKASPAKKGNSRIFDPVYITTKPTSRLGKADMHHMLLEDKAWTSLSAKQQATLVSMLPETVENQQLLARIKAGETENTRPRDFTLSNDCFRTDVAKFQEDLKNGHLVKTWQAAAEQAVIARAAGEYDAWKAEEAELWWGQKSK